MTPSPVAAPETVSVLEVVEAFHERQFRHLLIRNDRDEVVGIVSDRDVRRCFGLDAAPSRETLAAIPIARLMSTDLITVQPTTPLRLALRLMLDNGINALPVVQDGRAVGILTTTDLYLVLEQLLDSKPAETF